LSCATASARLAARFSLGLATASPPRRQASTWPRVQATRQRSGCPPGTSNTSPRGFEVEVRPTCARHVEVVLSAAASVSGTVREDGQPASGAQVFVMADVVGTPGADGLSRGRGPDGRRRELSDHISPARRDGHPRGEPRG
jgi:hypothetical protein